MTLEAAGAGPPTGSPGAPIAYAYVLAASHSGSTLLALLLNAHPDVATVGEIVSGARRVLEGYRCSCRRLIVECPFWAAVTDRMRQRHPSFDLADFGIALQMDNPAWVARLLRLEHRGAAMEAVRDGALGLSRRFRRHMAITEDRLRDLTRTILGLRNAHVLVDSSKLAHRLKFVLRMRSLDVKVIHLVRDGRAVALTYMDEQNFADAADPALRRGGRGAVAASRAMPMAQAAEEWRRAARSARHLLAGLDPSRWLRIHYEELCRAPDATLSKVCAFIGVDPGKQRLEFRSVAHHVVGNGMRLDSTSEIRLDERWRSVLNEAELAAFDAVAGSDNRHFGYE